MRITTQVITVLNGVIHCLLGYLLSFRELPAKVNKARVTSLQPSRTSDVTYTSVYSDSEPGRTFWGAEYEEVSEGDIPRVIVLGYDGLPLQPVAPPSPDYILGFHNTANSQDEDEREPMFIQAHDPDYVPEPIYPEYIPLEDDHEFPAEEQPLPPVDSPTAESPGYITESDPEEDPEEYEADRSRNDRLLPYGSALARRSDSTTQALIDAVTTALNHHLHYHYYPPSLSIPSPVDRRDDIPESEQPPRKRLHMSTICSRYEIGESSTARPARGQGIDYGFVSTVDAEKRRHGIRDVGYGIRDTWVDPAEAIPEIAPMNRVRRSNARVVDLQRLHERIHRIETVGCGGGAYAFPIAWAHSIRIGQASHQASDPSHSNQIVRPLRVIRDMRREMMTCSRVDSSARARRTAGQVRTRARIPDHQEGSGDADKKVHTSSDLSYCILLGAALTWWNGQIRTLGPEAYAMTWEVLKRKMTDKYCPQGEIKKLEIELWNLKVKGNDIPAYTERFQELTLICTKFVANETEKVDKYLKHGRQSDNKRKADDSSRNNHGHQQQPFKRQNVARAYNMGTGERKPYGGSLPKCNKCHLHHNGPCTQRCHKCNKIGHFARDCRSTGNTNVANTQKGNGATPKGNGCFECGAPGHFKRDCPKLKNKNGGNGNAQGWVYAVGNAEKRGDAPGNPDANVVTGTFLLNNHYASILFDTGADRSFISTAFSSLINIAPTSLENCYDVELADGKLVAINTIIRGCTLNFLDHPFNIDLMPVELGSFDVIIGMDWLRRYHAVIVCDEKLVQVPYGNETLTFRGNESSNGRESRLAVISYSKAQEYMAKGCQVFLAQISAKKEEDKSEKKQIEDVPARGRRDKSERKQIEGVPIVRDFPGSISTGTAGLPPAFDCGISNRLSSRSLLVGAAPYTIGPSERRKLRTITRALF
ncbi:putative reverse transcriptase domain-containing protein [Tanacetum coccineum]|uniref:Reverse transcriptase domain-containing protein n=1 Tax=Tanacetum coccineum TaxID=301880 RepID=A0ABQ4YR44_9ASTR